MSRFRRLIRLAARLSIAPLIVLSAAGACSKPEPVAGTLAGAAISVTVQPARLDSLRDVVIAPGTVVPAPTGDWTIFALEPGRIAELPKAEGETVKVGDVLVRFDVASLTDDLSARQNDVLQATARVDKAKIEVDRLGSLYGRGLTPRNDFEAAKGELALSETALTHAKAMFSASQLLGERAVVRARFAGVIANRWHNEGDFVSAGSTDPVIRVIDPTNLQVTAQVAIADFTRVSPGQQVTVMTVAGEAGVPGTVVARASPADASATSADARVSFAAPTTFTPGLPVRAEILVEERANVVVVPAAAVMRPEGVTYVMIAGADGLAHRRDVRVGLETRGLAQILVGVTVGDQVIVRGLDQVTDGAAIAIEK